MFRNVDRNASLMTAALVGLALVTGCGKGGPTGPPPPPAPADTFEEVIGKGGTYPNANESETSEIVEQGEEIGEDGTVFNCTTERRSIEQGSSDYALLDPNAQVIFPGSLLRGSTLGAATPEPIAVRRAGGTISISLLNGSNPSAHVEEIKYSTVQRAMNEIIAQNNGTKPARFQLQTSEVQSRAQLALAIGVNVETVTAGVSADLSFSYEHEYNRYLVRLDQQYYTMAYDLPVSADDIFAPEVTPEDLARYVGPGHPATYVSQVTYGRRFFLLVESTASAMDIAAAIEASYGNAAANVDAGLSLKAHLSGHETNIKVSAHGGDPGEALATFSGEYEAVRNFLVNDNGIDKGLPLSYVVRNVEDNTTVSIQVATDFEVKTCEAVAVGTYSEDFEGGTAGWTPFGPATLTHVENGDWSGGHVQGTNAKPDHRSNAVWYYRAPRVWSGDWSQFFGGTLSFDLRVRGFGALMQRDDILLTSGNGEELSASVVHTAPQAGFVRFELTLDGDAFGLTDDQVKAALKNIHDLKIRGRYMRGSHHQDVSWIDNIKIEAPQSRP